MLVRSGDEDEGDVREDGRILGRGHGVFEAERVDGGEIDGIREVAERDARHARLGVSEGRGERAGVAALRIGEERAVRRSAGERASARQPVEGVVLVREIPEHVLCSVGDRPVFGRAVPYGAARPRGPLEEIVELVVRAVGRILEREERGAETAL